MGRVPTFEQGRYSDVVREVYVDLLTTMGVSSSKASEVVKVGRLPGQMITFCKYMVLGDTAGLITASSEWPSY